MTTRQSLPLTPHPSRLTLECKPLIVIVGPTAVGKSQIAIQVAKELETEVLTADSRQVYRGMDIGTDKPSLKERQGVPHRLIDLVEPDQPFNTGEFRRLAVAEIARLHQVGRVPLVVGGTGLYVRTLLHGLCEGPPADWEFRRGLERDADANGADWLYRQLAQVDPESARRLHPNDRVKIIRALEVHHLLGRPLSGEHKRHAFAATPFTPLLIGLARERPALYRRIDERVELELAKGLVEETRGLLAKGYGRQMGSMKALGYKQMAGYLAGDYDYDEAVRLLKRDTRHFAKRQLTWFRKELGIRWMTIEDGEPAVQTAARVVSEARQFLAQLEADKLTGSKLQRERLSAPGRSN